MLINKNVVCKSLEELLHLVEKLEKNKEVKSFSFSGNYVKAEDTPKGGNAEIKRFSVNWEQEEII